MTLLIQMSSIFSHTQFLLFLLSLRICNISLASSSSREDDGFRRWVSWNVENYHRETWLNAVLTARAPGILGKKVVDWMLWKAEMNKVRKTVSQDGTGDYRTIAEALNSIPVFNTRRVILVIKHGVYREKINVPRNMSFVTFLGDSTSPPTITGNDTASVTGRDGTPLKTFQSATVAVDANYFVAVNIKFETLGKSVIDIVLRLNHEILSAKLLTVQNTAPHEVGSIGEQAVALRISGTKAAFYNCSFIGNQDTLYDHKGLHYFNNCFIQGSVDFIFGYGRSLYENCYLNSVAKKVASLTAQKRTNASLASGFSFKNSTITGSGLIYLGRAWGDYSRVIFSYAFMDRVVAPQGWSDWGDPKRDGRVYYGEYKCSGPGANTTGRVSWARTLTDEEAKPFLGTYYIEGDTWLLSP